MASMPGTAPSPRDMAGYSLVSPTPGDNLYDYNNDTTEAAPMSRWFFDGHYFDLTQIKSVYVIIIILSVCVMVVGLVGNAMVIAVVCRHRTMRTPTNFYILSLALSDFLVTSFVMPLKLLEMSTDADHNILSAAMCSTLGFVQPYFVFTSIWTLVAISIDRYLVIIHPLRSRSFNTRARASRNVAAIWVVPFLVLAPYFYPHLTSSYRMSSQLGVIRRTICHSDLPHEFMKWYAVIEFAVLLLVPVGLLCFTCFSIAGRLFRLTEDEKMLKTSLRKEEASRRKVAKMVLVVVFAFVMCWAPFFIVTLVNYFMKILSHSNFVFWQSVLLLFGFSNSCMNPIIYAFMSRAFRRGFRGIIVCFCPCTKPCFKNKSKFGNTRRSVTIISSEPATEACRVGGDGGCPRGKRRRPAPDRSSRWNNTQYSAVSETEGIDMARFPGNNANGGTCDHHHRQPKTSEESFTTGVLPTDSGSTGSHNPLWTSSNKPDNCIREQEEKPDRPSRSLMKNEDTPFEDVTLDDEHERNTVTDCNRNAPDHPTKHHHGRKPDTDAVENRYGQLPQIQQTEDNFRIENIGE